MKALFSFKFIASVPHLTEIDTGMKTALVIIFHAIGAIVTRETVKTTSTVALVTDRVKVIAKAVTGIMGTSRGTETGVGTKMITMGETAIGVVIIWVKTVAEGMVLF